LRIPLDGSRQRPHSSVPRLGSGHGRVLGRRRTRGHSAGELRCLGQDDAEPRGLRSQDRPMVLRSRGGFWPAESCMT